jgi:hypothetical protein
MVETKKAAQGLLVNQAPTVNYTLEHAHLQAKTDASIPIRLLIPTPVQWVRHI